MRALARPARPKSPRPPHWLAGLPLVVAAAVAGVSAGGPGDVGASFADRLAGPYIQPQVRQALVSEPTVRVLVTFREPPALRAGRLDVAALRSQVAAAQTDLLHSLTPTDLNLTYRYQAVPALAGRVTAAGLAALALRPEVAEVSLDAEGSAALGQSVPMIHADEVHDAGYSGAGVTVAVLDTGVDTDHPDLAGDIAYEACFLGGGGCPAGAHPAEDDQGHGTNVAGIITGEGIVAPVCVAPGAKIAAYKILNAAGAGFFSDWLAALDDIIANHPEVNIVNLSLQSSTSCPSDAITTAIETLRDSGVSTFIASGNHGRKASLTVPACIADGISVGAVYDGNVGSVSGWKTSCTDPTTAADQVACWSDSGDSLDLLAPGARSTAAGLGGGTLTFLGTSQASPHAAGVAALLLEAEPGLSVDDVEAMMEATGVLVTDDLDDTDTTTNRTTPRIDARVALVTNDTEDFDLDGCANGREFGAAAVTGGRRNPLNPWDYFNPTHDGENRVDDILAVAGQYFIDEGDPAYTEQTDRTQAGANPWDLGPPNGEQRIDDILAAGAQYYHDCA